MKRTKDELDKALWHEMLRLTYNLGAADHGILGTIGSRYDSLTDEDILIELRAINDKIQLPTTPEYLRSKE